MDQRVIRLLRFPRRARARARGTRRSVVTISCGDFNEYNQHALTRYMRFARYLLWRRPRFPRRRAEIHSITRIIRSAIERYRDTWR